MNVRRRIRIPRRVIVCFLSFLGVFSTYTLRTNISIAVVSMTTPYNVTLENGTVIQKADFVWDSKQRGYVLSAFFYGYAPVQLLGGWLGTKYGGAAVFGVGLTLTALVTLGTPAAAYCSFYVLILFRTLTGIFEGIAFPCIQSLMSKWAPRQEITTMISLIYTGPSLGIVVSSSVYGFIAYYLSWSWLFYISGTTTLILCLFWFVVVKESPQNDSLITEKELKYIQGATKVKQAEKMTAYSWRRMITSKHVWSIVLSHFADGWGVFLLITMLPTILTDIWQFRIKDAGYLSALPFTVTVVSHLLCGVLADYLIRKQWYSTTAVRKTMNSVGVFIPGTVFLMVTYFDSPYIAIALITFGNGCYTFSAVTLFSNFLDIAPEYSAILFGISSTVACTSGILGPIVAGHVVTNKSRYEWRTVFVITTAIYYVAGVIYLLFATSEIQEWSSADKSKSENRNGRNGNEELPPSSIECGTIYENVK